MIAVAMKNLHIVWQARSCFRGRPMVRVYRTVDRANNFQYDLMCSRKVNGKRKLIWEVNNHSPQPLINWAIAELLPLANTILK